MWLEKPSQMQLIDELKERSLFRKKNILFYNFKK